MGMNLLKAGHALHGLESQRLPRRRTRRRRRQGRQSPQEVAAASDFLLTWVSDPPALEEVLWSPAGACKPSSARHLHRLQHHLSRPRPQDRRGLRRTRRAFLDAPVPGRRLGRQKKESCSSLVGGDAETLKEAEPILAVMGKKIFHLARTAPGQTSKLAMNLILALQVDALARSSRSRYPRRSPRRKLVEVSAIQHGPLRRPRRQSANLLKGEYVPSFPLRLMQQGSRLRLDLANQLGVALPGTAAARETYNYVKGAARRPRLLGSHEILDALTRRRLSHIQIETGRPRVLAGLLERDLQILTVTPRCIATAAHQPGRIIFPLLYRGHSRFP